MVHRGFGLAFRCTREQHQFALEAMQLRLEEFCYAEGLGLFGLFSDILQIGQRGDWPEVNHEVGRLAILIDSEVVDGG
jgi:hypothetical protein